MKILKNYRLNSIFLIINLFLIIFLSILIYTQVGVNSSIGDTYEHSLFPTSFTIDMDNKGVCNAINNTDGSISWSSANASYVGNMALEQGGRILVKNGVYVLDSPWIITANSTYLIGESQGAEFIDFPIPPNPLPRINKGTVLRVVAENTDAIQVKGLVTNVHIQNIGIDFDTTNSGVGVNFLAAQDGLCAWEFGVKNVFVNGNSGNSYAFKFENCLEGYLEQLYNAGGAFMLFNQTPVIEKYRFNINAGDIMINHAFAHIWNVGEAFPFFINGAVNLGGMNYMQINDLEMHGQVSPTQTPIVINGSKYITFNNLISECEGNIHAIDIIMSDHINFCAPVLGKPELQQDWRNLNSQVYVFGGRLMLDLLDTTHASEYWGTVITSLNNESTCKLFSVRTTSGKWSDCTYTVVNTTANTIMFQHSLLSCPKNLQASFSSEKISGWSWTANETNIIISFTGLGLPKSVTAYVNATI